MATDLANVRAFFHLLPTEFSLPVVLVGRLAKRIIDGISTATHRSNPTMWELIVRFGTKCVLYACGKI